jgi:arylesterase/paraoxonase
MRKTSSARRGNIAVTTSSSGPQPAATPPLRPRRRRRLAAITGGGVLLLVAAFVGRVLWIGGAFTHIRPHFAGTCRLIDGPVGPEDITINQRSGRAYISASDRRALAAGKPVPGAIWAYDLTVFGALPVNLTPDAGVEFQPHGISLWVEPNGEETLFIVNHPAPSSGWPPNVVEIADLRDGRLRHRATLVDSRLVMPNDLVAVGIDRFYVTNTHRHAPGFLQTLETYLQLHKANVLFYGPGGFRVAVQGLLFPNGINASADGRTIYVASTTGRRVLVYDRDPESNALTLRDQIPIGSGGDNIEVDPDGTLWIGSHPKLLTVPKHMADPSVPAPAQILRIPAGERRVEEVYLSDGHPLSAASVGARYGSRLLIGQIAGRGFLDCEMASDS